MRHQMVVPLAEMDEKLNPDTTGYKPQVDETIGVSELLKRPLQPEGPVVKDPFWLILLDSVYTFLEPAMVRVQAIADFLEMITSRLLAPFIFIFKNKH
jgi:hypothetical protein